MLSLTPLANGFVPQALMASAITDWLSNLWAIVLMVIGFSLVIFVHELGHFVMAKLVGVRVFKFAIGFGKELFGRTIGETRYSFNILPLGGYVKMLGQEDFEIDKSGELKVRDDPRSFTNKSVGGRMLIVSAGVVMNIIFAALAFMVVFMVGLRTMAPKVGYVEPGSPAHGAGLMHGDQIVEINGTKMDDFSDVKRSITLADVDRPINLKIRREGLPEPFDVYIEPEWSPEQKVRMIGIGPPMTLEVSGVSVENEAEADREDRLKVGDVIVEVDGVKVKDFRQVEQGIIEKRGAYARLVVERPGNPADPDSPKRLVTCYHRAWMLMLPTKLGLSGQHLLGFQPRAMVQVKAGSPADKAGIRAGDVVVKWGDQWNPTPDECQQMILAKDEHGRYIHAGRDVEVIVRRNGLSKEIGIGPDRATGTVLPYPVLEPLLAPRDELMTQARKDPQAVSGRILEILGKHTTDELLLADARKDLDRAATSAQGLVRWLLSLDRESFVIRLKGSGFWGAGPPQPGVSFGALETDRLVVSDVVPEGLGGKPTPAAVLKLPRGALITHVNDTAVTTWVDLLEAFRAHAGQEVTIVYTHEGATAKGKTKIPQCLTAALDLPPHAQIVSIAGKKQAEFTLDGRTAPVSLPLWAAAYEILKANQGKTVPVVCRYGSKDVTTGADGKPLTYAVTADNVDPWLMRIAYKPFVITRADRIILQKKNPLAAVWMGVKKTVDFVIQVYKIMEHMIFTQKVGVENISGPVGILRIGHDMAQLGLTPLLYFLAIISANLAVINFLPLPIMDGGLMVFLILEKIRGRPVSIKMQVVTQIIGLVLIIGIFVFVTFMDVTKWVGQG